MLKVKFLEDMARCPSVANPGEDLGYDLYALEDTILEPGRVTKVRTGVAAEFVRESEVKYGLLIRDRSSMAAKGITVSAGVVDAGYRGELVVLLTWHRPWVATMLADDDNLVERYAIKMHDKIAQMIPVPVLTQGRIEVVKDLSPSIRDTNGFGSSGR